MLVWTPFALQVTAAGLSGVVTPVSEADPLGRGGQSTFPVQARLHDLTIKPLHDSPGVWQGTPVAHGWKVEFEQTFELQVPGSVEKPIR
jgi:hypothetical protein